MSLIEFIGFVISMGAMIFLVVKRWRDQWQRSKNPQEYAARERQEEEALKKLYRTLEGRHDEQEEDDFFDEEEEEHNRPILRQQKVEAPVLPPPPPPMPASDLTQSRKRPPNKPYEVKRQVTESRGSILMRQLTSKQQMVLLKEIFDKPLAIRDQEER